MGSECQYPEPVWDTVASGRAAGAKLFLPFAGVSPGTVGQMLAACTESQACVQLVPVRQFGQSPSRKACHPAQIAQSAPY